ncbi:ribonuclease R [Proteinivorax hydrogeniformans]|uniref:Ribonuclease R n=1 Tax=Proteinivorax hydrogeniformans TaxID=1826727 RepID=A0AAU8HVB6_9FIRM
MIKEKILTYMSKEAYRPLTIDELIESFQLDEKDIPSFKEILSDMEKQGEIIQTRSKRYGVPERMNLVVGRLQAHSKGFGFILSTDPEKEDVFVSPEDMGGALHNDKVVARLHKGGARRREGEIIRILERANTTVVGTFEKSNNFGFVTPDESRINLDIFVPKSEFNKAQNEEIVVVEITRWPEKRRNPEGRIIQKLGNKNSPGTDILTIMAKYKLDPKFPNKVMKEVEDVPEYLHEDELKGRKDFRDWPIITIDGEDAKDLDDGICVKKLDNGNFELSVHIADVSHYVRQGTALDKEAYERSTSVYLVDRVIPMLPEKLSNGLCSLNPRQDRLTMSIVMEIDGNGKVVKHDIVQGVINSKERMTYSDVKKILVDKDEELIARYKELVPQFRQAEELALILNKRRKNRGAIDFEFPEAKVELDGQGFPIKIVHRQRTIAERLIEEFMLVANETVAEHLARLEIPAIFRIHEQPAPEKITALNEFIHNFGYHLKGSPEKVHPKVLAELLEKIQGEGEQRVISTVTLRSMRQAKYHQDNKGHFGLAAKFYTHFTSPIRRYPDLMVHRILKWIVTGKMNEKRVKHLQRAMPDVGLHTSTQERKAEEAERETVDLKKVQYMEGHIGDEFEGTISGVTNFGMFVELPNTVEGLVHISNMTDDYYHYHEKTYSLVGEKTSKRYRLGDKVRVTVAKIDKNEKIIDFLLV